LRVDPISGSKHGGVEAGSKHPEEKKQRNPEEKGRRGLDVHGMHLREQH
jgi:hypothetical protein